MKYMIVLLFALLPACASVPFMGGGAPVNFEDGTWSTCTYKDPSGRVVTPPPIQLGNAPMEWTEPDGTSVKCKGIPKADPPEVNIEKVG